MVDFGELLENARSGAPRSLFTPYMDEIADPNEFNDATRLRLLGNAIANCPENAAILAGKKDAINKLLGRDPLGLQVLYNGTVGNKDFAGEVLKSLVNNESRRIVPSPAMKNLLGSIWDQCGPDVPREFVIRLVVNGFVELVVQDPTLEVEPEIIKNFKTIYTHCQHISLDAQDADDVDSLGFLVVGNITSNPKFTIEMAEGITENGPFTWETVVLLCNLTAEKVNMHKVLADWPHLVEKTIKLIEAEDPDFGDEETPETFEQDEGAEPPFDLELWGALFRNIARDPASAKEIAKHHPSKLFARLLSSPTTQEVAGDFAAAFAANCYDHDLTEMLTAEPHNGGSVIVVSALVSGLSADTPSKSELDWAIPRIVRTLIEGMLVDAKEGIWIKGTKALALLNAEFKDVIHADDVGKLHEHELAARSEPVKHNLESIQ